MVGENVIARQEPPRTGRRRVLVVVGSYAPAMNAEMHRARQLAWELPKLGWHVDILAPDKSYQSQSYVETDSAGFFPTSGRVIIAPLSHFEWLFRWLRMKSIGWRAFMPMYGAGSRALRDHYDIVYFSTTQFCLFLLGPLWRSRFHIPYVLDFHDPALKEGDHPVWAKRSLRHTVAQWLAKYVEAGATLGASAIVSVSPTYVEQLAKRYCAVEPVWAKEKTTVVIPFGVLEHDFDEVRRTCPATRSEDEKVARIVYVGVGGPVMKRSFDLLIDVLEALRAEEPAHFESVRFEFYGTSLGWNEGDPRHLADSAKVRGLGEFVIEMPDRISYRRSLELLLTSDGTVILGVDDAGYMPSKLFPYAASGKPLLAVLRRDGPAFAHMQSAPGLGRLLWFDDGGAIPLPEAVDVLRAFLEEVVGHCRFDRRTEVAPFAASAMAARHAQLFERVLALNVPRPNFYKAKVSPPAL